MKTCSSSPLRRIWACLLLLAIALAPANGLAQGALYHPGDIMTNLTFYARRAFTLADGTMVAAGAPVRLQDFVGRIVYLEWFAVWCPFCTAAVPQVDMKKVSKALQVLLLNGSNTR